MFKINHGNQKSSCYRLSKKTAGLTKIHDYLQQFRSSKKIYISPSHWDELMNLLKQELGIQVRFGGDNPLSVMETLTLILATVTFDHHQRADILGVATNTLRSYESNARVTLDAASRWEAIMILIRREIIQFIAL